MNKLKALVFGTGSMAENILPAICAEVLEVKAYIDERPSRRGTIYAGSSVIEFSQITGCSFDYILVACRPAERVNIRLRGLGIPQEKIVTLDVENLFWEQGVADKKALSSVLLEYLQSFPGLVQAIDVPVLLDSPWLKNVLNNKKQTDELAKTLVPDNEKGKALLASLAAPLPVPEFPKELSKIHIESTNICAYRCFCCSVWNTRRPKGILSEESLHLLIKRVGMFRGEVALNYCGEPLQDKGLPQKIKILRQAWPDATLNFVSTLGEKVDSSWLDELWDNGLNRLDVSFYGYTPELYKTIHGVDRYALAEKNLLHILSSESRKRKQGKVRVRCLHVEEQAPFLVTDYPALAADFRAKVEHWPDVSWMDMYLMSQAGAGKVSNKRGTRLPCSIAWGGFARELYVTWELDVTLCCATTGDELRLGNLRDQTLQEIFDGEAYQRLIQAHWDDRLEAYPFCNYCERHINGASAELVRIAAWKIANILQQNGGREQLFSIVGEPRLAGPLTSLYRQHFSQCIPLDELLTKSNIKQGAYIFIAAQGNAQLEYYKDICDKVVIAEKAWIRVIPLLGVGFPQSQAEIISLAKIYDELDIMD